MAVTEVCQKKYEIVERFIMDGGIYTSKNKKTMIITKKEKIFLPAKKFGVSQMCEYRVIKHEKGGKYTLKATSYCVEPNIRTIIKSQNSNLSTLEKAM